MRAISGRTSCCPPIRSRGSATPSSPLAPGAPNGVPLYLIAEHVSGAKADRALLTLVLEKIVKVVVDDVGVAPPLEDVFLEEFHLVVTHHVVGYHDGTRAEVLPSSDGQSPTFSGSDDAPPRRMLPWTEFFLGCDGPAGAANVLLLCFPTHQNQCLQPQALLLLREITNHEVRIDPRGRDTCPGKFAFSRVSVLGRDGPTGAANVVLVPTPIKQCLQPPALSGEWQVVKSSRWTATFNVWYSFPTKL